MLNAVFKQKEEAIKSDDDAEDESTTKMKEEIASHFEQGKGYYPRAPQI